MSFIQPHVTHKDYREVNQHNLAVLQNYDAEVQPLTKPVLGFFKEIAETRLGAGYYTRKYTITALAFLGTIAVPVIGGGWALSQLVPRTPAAVLGTFGAGISAFFINKVAESTFSFSPAKFIVTLSRNAIVHAAGKVSDATLGSYRAYEENTFKRHRDLYEVITKGLLKTFDGMAHELSLRYDEAKSSPARLVALKDEAKAISSNLIRAKRAISETGLQAATIDQITNALEDKLGRIDALTLELKTNDPAHNKELLISGSLDDVCIPQKAQDALETAKAHTFGNVATVTKYIASVGAGALGFAAIYVGTNSRSLPMQLIASTATSLVAGAATYNLHDKKEREFAQIALDCRQEAHVIVQEAYDATAACFLTASNKRGLLKDARALKERMPQIVEALARHDISEEVTLKLNQALDTIISPPKATKTKATTATRKSERLAKKSGIAR